MNIFEEMGFSDPKKKIIKKSIEDVKKTQQSHESDVPFEGYCNCTLCDCGHYVGGDKMTDICKCGHQKQNHVFSYKG